MEGKVFDLVFILIFCIVGLRMLSNYISITSTQPKDASYMTTLTSNGMQWSHMLFSPCLHILSRGLAINPSLASQ